MSLISIVLVRSGWAVEIPKTDDEAKAMVRRFDLDEIAVAMQDPQISLGVQYVVDEKVRHFEIAFDLLSAALPAIEHHLGKYLARQESESKADYAERIAALLGASFDSLFHAVDLTPADREAILAQIKLCLQLEPIERQAWLKHKQEKIQSILSMRGERPSP